MIIETSLRLLATNFHSIMFGDEIMGNPKAEYFTITNDRYGRKYWEICDVKESGFYPCCSLGTSSLYNFDQESKVNIYLKSGNENIIKLVFELNERESKITRQLIEMKIEKLESQIAELKAQLL
jgi:hypothetical protein